MLRKVGRTKQVVGDDETGETSMHVCLPQVCVPVCLSVWEGGPTVHGRTGSQMPQSRWMSIMAHGKGTGRRARKVCEVVKAAVWEGKGRAQAEG